MQNWRKQRNHRKIENPDGTFIYVITVDGLDVEVSAEVYGAYAKGRRKMEYMEYDLKRDRILQDAEGKAVRDASGIPVRLPEREVSLEKMMGEDWDDLTDEPQPEEMVLRAMEIEALRRCLDLLTQRERTLIRALFYEGKTEREYATETGMLQQTIHARKRVILAKLKKLLGKQK